MKCNKSEKEEKQGDFIFKLQKGEKQGDFIFKLQKQREISEMPHYQFSVQCLHY